jgi:hypothetical protein
LVPAVAPEPVDVMLAFATGVGVVAVVTVFLLPHPAATRRVVASAAAKMTFMCRT